MTKVNFALIGAGGYVAPRHIRAIHETGNRLVAAVDPKDSVGILDHYAFDVRYFTEVERFDRHLEKLRRGPVEERVSYVTVATPNYLHDAHCRLGLRIGADVICEKPLVVNPWNLDALHELSLERDRRVYSVLQLRLHDRLRALRETLRAESNTSAPHEVELTYISARGHWYDASWKGQLDKSGGISANLGVHFFDLLVWLFGEVETSRVHLSEPRRMAGFLALARARVRWFLSIEKDDLPFPAEPGKRTTYRSIRVDGEELEFSEGFDDLHTKVYAEILAGRGYGIEDTRAAITLAHSLRQASLSPLDDTVHPLLRDRR